MASHRSSFETHGFYITDLTKGDTTLTLTSKTVEGKTRPPSHFTEASLLGSMEKAGRDLEDDELKRAMKGAGVGYACYSC